MILPNILITQPTHVDFPLFRYQMEKYKKYFNKLIICFSPGIKDRNLEEFFRKNMPDAEFVMPYSNYPDWRQNSMMALLNRSNTDYVILLEQDFMIKDENFFEKLYPYARNNQFIGYSEGDRIHPAFSIIKTELLYLTSKDFSAYPDQGMDHFGKFFKELCNLVKFRDIREFGLKERKDFYHLAGCTQNFHCFREGQPFYKPDEFLTYNSLIQKLPIVQDQTFMSYCEGIEKAFKNPNNETIRHFFPMEVTS